MGSMCSARHRRMLLFPALGAAAAIALSAAACSRGHAEAQAANAPIGIQTSQLFVTIENRAGAPLTDLAVSIVAGPARFTKRIDRLEDAEKQDVSLGDFTSPDGTPFNLRFYTPTRVQVTATDVANRKYDVSAAWQ